MAQTANARTPASKPPATPSLREEQKRLTRTKLLEAAQSVFQEKGYTNATIDDIVERAGASRGTYYLYYRNKTEVLEELLEEFNDRARDLAGQLAGIESNGTRQVLERNIERWIAAFVDLYREHRLSIRAWIQAEGSEPVMHASTDRNMNRFLEVLTDRIGAIRNEMGLERKGYEDRIRAMLMLVQLERFCYFWLIRGWKIDRKIAIPTVAKLWYATIYSDAA